MRKVHILVSDNNLMARKGIVETLKNDHLITSILVSENDSDVANICDRESVDVIIMEFSNPIINKIQIAKKILDTHKKIKIIALTQYDELPIVQSLLKLGAKGFLPRTSDEEEIRNSVRTVMNGDYYFRTKFEGKIKRWLKSDILSGTPFIKFSTREIELVKLISYGKTSGEIAEEIGISIRTVETYRYDLIKKTKVQSAPELVGYAYRNGII